MPVKKCLDFTRTTYKVDCEGDSGVYQVRVWTLELDFRAQPLEV